jgi:hypothetical protein
VMRATTPVPRDSRSTCTRAWAPVVIAVLLT